MNARDVRVVLDRVPPPVVEYPRLARSHVNFHSVAFESHIGMRDDGYVNAGSVDPVVIDVAMRRHDITGCKSHKTGSGQNALKRCENLLDVLASLQRRRHHHFARHVVVLLSIGGYQPNRRITFVVQRVCRPVRVGKLRKLVLKTRYIESYRKPNKWGR